MGNLAYFPLADDLVEDATVVVVTEDTDYPQENLQNIPMADTARASDPPAAIVRVRIDFGAVVNPPFWAFLNHNIASGDWKIHRTNAAWVSAQERTVSYRALDKKSWGSPWGGGGSQYFEVEFPAACTYNHAFWEMGKIVCGSNITEFTYGIGPGIKRGFGHSNIHNITEHGIEYVHIKQAKINYLKLGWARDIKETLLDELLDFLETTYGGAYPSLIIPDNDNEEFWYMRNEDRLNWNEEIARSVIEQCYMNFKEMSRGKVILT